VSVPGLAYGPTGLSPIWKVLAKWQIVLTVVTNYLYNSFFSRPYLHCK